MHEHEIVLYQDKDTLVGDFKSLALGSLMKVVVAQVGNVDQRHRNHEMYLYASIAENRKSQKHEQRSTNQKDKRVPDATFVLSIEADVQCSKLRFDFWLIQTISLLVQYTKKEEWANGENGEQDRSDCYLTELSWLMILVRFQTIIS